MGGWEDQPQAGNSSRGLTPPLLALPPPASSPHPRDTAAGGRELPVACCGHGHAGWRGAEGGDPGERPAAGPGSWAEGTRAPWAPHVTRPPSSLGLPYGAAKAPLRLGAFRGVASEESPSPCPATCRTRVLRGPRLSGRSRPPTATWTLSPRAAPACCRCPCRAPRTGQRGRCRAAPRCCASSMGPPSSSRPPWLAPSSSTEPKPPSPARCLRSLVSSPCHPQPGGAAGVGTASAPAAAGRAQVLRGGDRERDGFGQGGRSW